MTLKPCPWCGKEPRTQKVEWQNRKVEMYQVECINTHCKVMPETLGYDTEKEAISAWNERKADEES